MKPIKPFAIIAFLAVFAFSGCVTISDEDIRAEAAKVGYGAELAPDWQEKIKARMETRLKDSASAIYKFGTPYHGFIQKAPIAGGGLMVAGWVCPVMINAKNSYGGYTGFEAYNFLIRDNAIAKVQSGGVWLD